MSLWELLLVNAAVVGVLMLLVWAASVALRDASIIDPVWGLGFAAIGCVTMLRTSEPGPRTWILLALVCLWGLRLSAYLAWRKIGTPEDHRYREMRDRAGPSFWLSSLFWVFGLQAVIMLIVALPLLTGMSNPALLGPFDYLGIAVWSAGILFESVGDWQLARFKSDPVNRGQVLDRGLWRYTRHPNYFGDFLVWWGIYLVALGDGRAAWTAIGPLLMSILLMRVSGVTLLERSLRTSKPAYEEYMRRTSAFFPWPPKTPR